MLLKVGTPIPDAVGNHALWLNNAPPTGGMGNTLIHFWAMSCPSCHANMPHLQKLRDTYKSSGVNIIAVHMPRGEYDLDSERLGKVVAELGVIEPCAVDNEHTIGDAFGVDAWPAYYLFDADGKLRRRSVGNFGVRMMEQALLQLFGSKEGEKP